MRLSIALLFVASQSAARAYTMTLTPGQEVPPTPSTASGQGTLNLDASGMLRFEINIEGLHGSETEASIHGPAAVGADAGVLFALPLGNTKSGSVGPLTPTQIEDLDAGLWYVNIHTTHHRSGEIRGQIGSAVAVDSTPWGQVKALYRRP